jgi:hypothetical protein
MKTVFGFVMLLLLAAAFFFITVSISGLAISTANSWILGGNFSDAWSLVWERKFVVFAWTILFYSPALFSFSANKAK